MKYSDEQLMAMNADKIRNLHANCRKNADNKDAAAILAQIERLDLLSRPVEGMRLSDPVYMEMQEIINSSEGRKRMLAAVEAGLPALAGVEPMIVARLGSAYSKFNQGTQSAGSIVGAAMYSMGFRKGDAADMPAGSVATTAATWLK